MLTVVYVVTYRIDSTKPQEELLKYTRESADTFAATINEVGGVAVVTEDIRTLPDTVNDDLVTVPQPKGLIWEDEHEQR
jgi:hypothetical protein